MCTAVGSLFTFFVFFGSLVNFGRWRKPGRRCGNRRSDKRMVRKQARLMRSRCNRGRGRNLSRLLRCLVCGLVCVSGVCWIKQTTRHNYVNRDQASTSHWLNASAAAPTVYVTPPRLRNPPRGFLGYRSNSSVLRGCTRESRGYPGTSVACIAAKCSSFRRYGAGKNNGGMEGASCRGEGSQMTKRNGKTKGIVKEEVGVMRSIQKKGEGVGVGRCVLWSGVRCCFCQTGSIGSISTSSPPLSTSASTFPALSPH